MAPHCDPGPAGDRRAPDSGCDRDGARRRRRDARGRLDRVRLRDPAFAARLAAVLADHDDALLADFVDDEDGISADRLSAELARQSRRALVHPVFFGSAVTGAGLDGLTAGISRLLPAVAGDAEGDVRGTVFKVERGPAGEKVAYVRMFSGAVRIRDRLRFGSNGDDEGTKVTAISVFDGGGDTRSTSVGAGRIGKLWGLADVRIGDTIGGAGTRPIRADAFARPTIESVVLPRCAADKGALHVALSQLAEQDPLINLRQDDVRQELFVSLYGEVQKEVIESTLATDFGIEVEFHATTPIYIERPGRRRAKRSSRSAREARRRSWPGSGCGSSPRRLTQVSTSGSRSSSDRCRSRSSGQSKRRCSRRCSRASTAGRPPTAP